MSKYSHDEMMANKKIIGTNRDSRDDRADLEKKYGIDISKEEFNYLRVMTRAERRAWLFNKKRSSK